MRLIITNNKERYLNNCNTLDRPKLLSYSELLSLIYSEPKNLDAIKDVNFEHRQVLLKNVLFAKEDVNPDLYKRYVDLGITEKNLSHLSHYKIEADFILDPVIEAKLPNFRSMFEEVELLPREIIQCSDLFHECQYIVNEVSRLLYEGANINDIKIIVPNKEYENTIYLYLSMNNINYYYDTSINLARDKDVQKILKCSTYDEMIEELNNFLSSRSTYLVSLIDELLKCDSFNEFKAKISEFRESEDENFIRLTSSIISCETFEEIKTTLEDLRNDESNKNDNAVTNKLIGIINSSKDIDEIKHKLKNAKISYYKIVDAIEVTNLKEFDVKYVFVAGVFENSFDLSAGKNDFLSDELKERLGLKTSKDATKEKISLFNTVVNKSYCITKPLANIQGEVKPIKILSIIEDIGIYYYSQNLELVNKVNYNNLKMQFGEETARYGILKDKVELTKTKDYTFIPYNVYSDITFSATSLEMFNKCSYSFYLKYILKLDSKEKVIWNIELGKLAHHLLQYGHEFDDLEEELVRYVNKIENINIVDRQVALNMGYFYTKFVKYAQEQFCDNVKYDLEKKIKSEKIKAIGTIDKYLELNNEFMILDYKTGSNHVDFGFVRHGIEIQNLFYAYMIELEENKRFVGSFKQKAKPKVLKEKKNYGTEYSIKGKINKTVIINPETTKLVNKNGEISKSYALSREVINICFGFIEENLLDVKTKIKNAEFNINPKRHGSTINACKHCNYNSICYKTRENYISIDKIEDFGKLEKAYGE